MGIVWRCRQQLLAAAPAPAEDCNYVARARTTKFCSQKIFTLLVKIILFFCHVSLLHRFFFFTAAVIFYARQVNGIINN